MSPQRPRLISCGACLCTVLLTSIAAGAKPPPPRSVEPILSTAIGATGTYVGQVRFVDDQVNGNVYRAAVREDEQRRRIALYDAEPLVESNPDLVMGPTGRIIGFDAHRDRLPAAITGPTGSTGLSITGDAGSAGGGPTGPAG